MMTETPQYSDAVHKVLRGLRRDIPTYTEDDYKTAPRSGRVCIGVRSIYSKPVIRFCPKYGAIYMRKVMGRIIDFLDLETNTVIQSHQKNAYDGFWNVYEVPCTHSQSKECQLEVDQPETGQSKPRDNSQQIQKKQNMDLSQVKSEQQRDVRLSKDTAQPRTRHVDHSLSSKTTNKFPFKKLLPIIELSNDSDTDTAIALGACDESYTSNKSLDSSQIKTIKTLVNCQVKTESEQPGIHNINNINISLDQLHHYPIRTQPLLLYTPRLRQHDPNTIITMRKSVNSSSSVNLLHLSWVSKSAIENSSKIMSSIIWNANKAHLGLLATTDDGIHSYTAVTRDNVDKKIRQNVESEDDTFLKESIFDVSMSVYDDQCPINPKPVKLIICARSGNDSSNTETRNSTKTPSTTDLYSISNDGIEDAGKLRTDASTDANKTQLLIDPEEESITTTFNLLARQTSIKQKQRPEVEPRNVTLKDISRKNSKVTDENSESMMKSRDCMRNKDILINSDSVIGILGIYASGQQHCNMDCVSIKPNDDHDDNDDHDNDDDGDDDDDDNELMSGLFGVFTRDC